MKKIFALFLVLCVAGPVAALACDCCHGAEANPAHTVIRGGEDCCPMIGAGRENRGIEQRESSIIPSTRISTPRIFSSRAVLAIIPDFEFNFDPNHFSPPLFFSETPLYLAHQTLRL